MSIEIDQKLPDSTLHKIGGNGPETIKLSSLYTNRKLRSLLCRELSPTCSSAHLPSIIETADKFSSKGIDEILCISVNDPHVVSAWEYYWCYGCRDYDVG